jgi:signal transduction histidine kinase
MEDNRQVTEMEFITKNSKIFPVEVNSSLIEYNKEKAILIIVRDITERKLIQRSIFNAIIQTEEKERKRFAQDLHDGIGALLSSINIYINLMLSHQLEVEEEKNMLRTMKELLDEAIQSAKEIANNIRPNVLSNFGLIDSLNSFFNKINNTGTININFESSEFENQLEQNTELILYRVINELVNNTIKHAAASCINIKLSNAHSSLQIYYDDNGKGFDLKEALNKGEESMGLKNITSRVQSIGGNCEFDTKIGAGTRVRIQINFNKQMGSYTQNG